MICIIAVLIVIGMVLFKMSSIHQPEETIDLAIVSSLDNPSGKDMVDGARLYINEMNQKGGLFGKQLILHVFDDKGNARKASQIASTISENNQILLVLGHDNNDCSIAAGRIYKKVGIPAIAPSASSEFVTRDNEFYFRIIPNNEFQAKFIAHYIYHTLNIPSACMIYDSDDYGKILSSTFETEAKKIGLHLTHKWQLTDNENNESQALNQILVSLRSVKNPGILFLATHAPEAEIIISTIHYPKTKLQIIGTYEISDPLFIDKMRKQLFEQKYPGYFSDGVYAVLPYMNELTDETGIQFINHYVKTFHKSPTWFAASYYDACKLACEAIKKSGISNDAIGKKRIYIKDALQSMYHVDYAVKGTLGYIFFNQHGDVQAPIKVGTYDKQNFIPAFAEYQLEKQNTPSQDLGKKIIAGEKLIIDDLVFHKTQIIYTGISVHQIDNLDIKKQTCRFDFFIWFKYKGMFDPENIVFENAIQPIHLEKPVIETIDNINIRSYHVVAEFKHNFDFRAYPFDKQHLSIIYHHKTQPHDNLIFVIDRNKLPSSKSSDPTNMIKLHANTEWTIINDLMFQNIMTHESRIGHNKKSGIQTNATYSQIKYSAQIKRLGLNAELRVFFPIITLTLILSIILFLPDQRLGVQLIIITGALITNAIYHIHFLATINTQVITAIEYIHIGLYGAVIYLVFYLILLYYLKKNTSFQSMKGLRRTMGIIFFCSLIGLGLFVYYGIGMDQNIFKGIWSKII